MIADSELGRVVVGGPEEAAATARRVLRLGSALGLDPPAAQRLAGAVGGLLRRAVARGGTAEADARVEQRPHGPELVVRVLAPAAPCPGGSDPDALLAAIGPPVERVESGAGRDGLVTVALAARLPAAPAEIGDGGVLGAPAEAPPSDEAEDAELVRLHGEIVDLRLELHTRRQELDRLHAELEETNRGVVALYAQLAEVNETLETIIGGSPLAIVALDGEGRVERWNPAAERMFGWSAADVLGRPLPTIDPEEAGRIQGAAAAGETYADDRAVRRRRDGSRIDVSVSTGPLRDAEGRVRGRIAVFADVTARRRAEEERDGVLAREQELRAAAETAAARLRDVGQVTEAALAHLDLEDLLRELMARIRAVLGVETIAVFLLADDGDALVVRAALGLDEARVADVRVPVAHDAQGRPQVGREPFVVADLGAEGIESPILEDGGVRSLAAVPLLVGGREIGVLHVGSRTPRRFDEDDVRLLQVVADRVALAIEHARLYRAEHLARRRAERTAERVSALQAVTAALSEVATGDEVLDLILREARASVGARGASVVLLDDEASSLAVARAAGYDETLVRRWARIPLDSGTPLAEAVHTGRPVLVGSRAELRARFPALAVEAAEGARAAVPLTVEGRVLGALGLSFGEARAFDDDERDFLVALARQCGQALERARLLEAERDARAESERARERLVLLADASAVLASSLEFEATLPKLARLLVPRVADLCFIDLLDARGTFERHAYAHANPEHEAAFARLAPALAPRVEGDHPSARAVRGGRTVLLPVVDPDLLERTTRSEEHRELYRRTGPPTSAVAVPLVARGRTLGCLLLLQTTSNRRFGPGDLALVEDLGRRVALAVDNARLYADRVRVAQTLQRTLLPHRLPDVVGAELGARYRAAAEGVDVGGDFYDVFEVADGAWFLVMGDVCGKGVDAAALTGLIRYTVRAAAMRDRDPAEVLRLLNAAVLAQSTELRFATVVCARLDLRPPGRARFTLACGGHPLPFVRRADGRVEQVGTPGSLIGAVESVVVTDVAVDLSPGDAVVLYTDGVIEERRVGGQAFGEEGLRRLLARDCADRDADAIAGLVERAVVEFTDEPPRDDLAVLVTRIVP